MNLFTSRRQAAGRRLERGSGARPYGGAVNDGAAPGQPPHRGKEDGHCGYHGRSAVIIPYFGRVVFEILKKSQIQALPAIVQPEREKEKETTFAKVYGADPPKCGIIEMGRDG